MADPHRDVDGIFHEIDEVVRQPQFAGDLGIALEVGDHDRPDMEAAEADRRRHHQPPARPVALLPCRAVGLLDIGENATRALEIARADVGQGHLSGGPLQQPRAEMLLQRRDQPRHRGRGQPQLSCRGREAAQIGDGDEDMHGFEAVHGIIAYIAMMKCQAA